MYAGLFIRNTRQKAFAAVLSSLPDRIIEHSLWRDQIVLPYHMQYDYDMIDILDGEGAPAFRHCERRTYVDLGSGTGDTLLGLQADYGECHAFEANSDMFERLKAQTCPKCGTVKLHHKAAWVSHGSVDFFYPDNKSRGISDSVGSIDTAAFLNLLPLGSLIVLNIDIESAGDIILRHLLDSVLAFRRVSFLVAPWNSMMPSAFDVETRVQELYIVVCGNWCANGDPMSSKKWATAHRDLAVCTVKWHFTNTAQKPSRLAYCMP